MRLERFRSLVLSQIDGEDTLDTAPAVSALIDTIAGPYDNNGDDDARVGPYMLSRVFAVHGDTPDDMDDAADLVRAELGKTGNLWARMGDDSVRRCTARLMGVRQLRTRRNFNFQPLRCDWEVRSTWWGHDNSVWTFDSGESFDAGLYFDEGGFTETMASSPHTITVTNGGNRRVDNAVIRITAGGSSITALTIAKTGETDIDYTASIASGDVFVLDCGAMLVTNDGTADYDNLDLGSSHVIPEWLRLDPGDNDIIITFTGGSTDSTVTVEFTDGWA